MELNPTVLIFDTFLNITDKMCSPVDNDPKITKLVERTSFFNAAATLFQYMYPIPEAERPAAFEEVRLALNERNSNPGVLYSPSCSARVFDVVNIIYLFQCVSTGESANYDMEAIIEASEHIEHIFNHILREQKRAKRVKKAQRSKRAKQPGAPDL